MYDQKKKRAKWSDLEKFLRFVKSRKRRKTEKEPQHLQQLLISDNNEGKKSISNMAESEECCEISTSNSKWKTGSNVWSVTCLKSNKIKISKPIYNYLDAFIHISLNHKSIIFRLVSQPINKLIKIKLYQFVVYDLW